MISVTEAEKIVQATTKNFGSESICLVDSIGRVLAENITADRPLPPYDRVTMDGIAINFDNYNNGKRTFYISGTQAAGATPIDISNEECIEIMTGAALPNTADTVIRYEDVSISGDTATINIDTVKKGQNIHYTGSDTQQAEVLASAQTVITPALINTAASVGKTELLVQKLPKVVVIATGEELVDINETPTLFQIRRSNSYAINAVLQNHQIKADMLHIVDDKAAITNTLDNCLQNYDVLILSGGVSMGKYDYLPQVFEQLGIKQLFHKVQQRPGKPFWFGTHSSGKTIFAFPGNPVSTFMCTYRYFVPWLLASLGIDNTEVYAVLDEDYQFEPSLQYFLQVKITCGKDGVLRAIPSESNGSGDFVNLLNTDAFMELPAQQTNFKKGEVYKIWPYKHIVS